MYAIRSYYDERYFGMNISDPFRFAAQYCPDKKALIFGEARYTYGEMNRIIDGIAHYMKDLGA